MVVTEAIQRRLQRSKRRGGEIVTEFLAAAGVDTVFGIIDGTYFGLYATLGDHGIRLITPRHETSAAHMAGAYARSTGKLGVCIASNGPGVANILPGVAVEEAEGNRVLLITSCRRHGIVYPERGGTYQHFPQVAVIGAMAKWSAAVPSADRLPEILRHALRLAHTGRPGVVHVDIPEDLMNGRVDLDPREVWGVGRLGAQVAAAPAPEAVREAAAMLREAEAPVIHAGSGVIHSGAYDELARVAAILDAPVTTSWAARGAIDERSPYAVSMIFVETVSKARREADLVLTLGSRLGETDWWGKAPYWGDPAVQKMIQVDLEAEWIGRNKPVDLPIQADVKAFLVALAAELEASEPTLHRASRRRRLRKLQAHRRKRRAELDEKLDDRELPLHPAHVATVCQEAFGDDAICVMDGGNTCIWANFYHEVRHPNTVLGTAKMGMLGAGVSQALGAQAAHPDRQVYCIIGDGAMGFHLQEVETAVRNRLPVIYLVLCDKQWGMVKMNQQFTLNPVKTLVKKSLGPHETINADLGEIEFDVVARGMGAYGERVSDPDGLADAIHRARRAGGPAVIHVDVHPVKHMWAPELRTFKAMHEEPKG